MSEDATIEDEAEAEEQGFSSQPQTKTGLLPWSYIFEIGKYIFLFVYWNFDVYLVTKQWAMFLIVSIAIAVFLYVNAHQQRSKKENSSAIRRDHIQGGSKGVSRKSPKRE